MGTPGGLPSTGPPSGRGGPGLAIFAVLGTVLVVLVIAMIAVFVLTDGEDPITAPPSSSTPSEPPSTSATTMTAEPPSGGSNGQPPIPSLPDLGIGDCVELTGSEQDAQAIPSACDAGNATHRVVQVVPNRDGCPADVNVAYFQTFFNVDAFTLCLDVNWIRNVCYDVTDGLAQARRVNCSAVPGRRIERVEAIQRDATDVNGCTEGGFTYAERRFVVCTITV